MKLVDMNPSWYSDRGGHGQGLLFDCPVHGGEHKIGVPFENPIDGGPKTRRGQGKNGDKWWTRTGETFETLTLTPSLHMKDGDPDDPASPTHWHGFVTNGSITGG